MRCARSSMKSENEHVRDMRKKRAYEKSRSNMAADHGERVHRTGGWDMIRTVFTVRARARARQWVDIEAYSLGIWSMLEPGGQQIKGPGVKGWSI
eukprot:568978-Pleurochrysis_carterae.AAC.4